MNNGIVAVKGRVAVLGIMVICLFCDIVIPQNLQGEEEYPNKPIEILCGSGAGSFTDVSARIIGEKLSKILKVPVLISDRPGAMGKVALRAAVKAKPDGYTLITLNQATLVVDRVLDPEYPVDPEKDLMPIYEYGAMPSYATVNSSSPWKTLREFIDDAKNNPDKFDVGTAGAGSTSHLILEILCNQSGARIKHVPFKGGTTLVTQVLGGHISAVFTGNPTLLNNIEAGNLRALAIFADERDPRFPHVPTVAEAGYPDANLPVWAGFFAPAKTPVTVHRKLVAAFQTAIRDPEVISSLKKIGLMVSPKKPEEMTEHMKSQYLFLREFVKKTGIVK